MSAEIESLPTGWRAILQSVQTIEPGAILAGGAMRDWDNGRLWKDLDIFIPSGGNTRAITDMLRGKSYRQTRHFDAGYRNVDHTIEDVSTFEANAFEPPIGIIRMARELTPEQWLARFDFGICQIAFDGQQITRTAAYLKDQAQRQFTVTRSDTPGQLERTRERFKRLREKYPDWTLVVPNNLPANRGTTL